MSNSHDNHRLTAWPFWTADLVLLAVAAVTALSQPRPYATPVAAVIAVCVLLAVLVGIIPTLVNYMSGQDAALDDRQRQLEHLAATLTEAGEQIGIAANALRQLTELAEKQLHAGEALGQKMERLGGETQAKLDKAGAGLRAAQAALEKASIHPRAEAPAPVAPVAPAAPPPAAPPPPAMVVATPPPVSPPEPAPAASVAESSTVIEPTPAAAPPPPHRPRKPKPPPAAELPLEVEPKSTPPGHPTAPTEARHDAKNPPAEKHPEPAPAAKSDDGGTRLLVTAYIGIGNRIFVRGDAPGLRSDQGVPLQFVSIGKWRWSADGLTVPAKLRLFKNDELECAALGELTLNPGQTLEVNAVF